MPDTFGLKGGSLGGRALLVGLGDYGADAFAAERDDDACLCEHVISSVAAVVQRRFGVVIVFCYKYFGNAGEADVEGAALAWESDHVELGTGRHLAAGIVERVDFGMHHERVFVGFEFVVAYEGACVGIEKVVGEELFFAGVRNGFVVESGGCAVVACADDASVCTDENCAHLRILIFRKACLSTHHLRIDFVAKLCSRTIHAENIGKI